MKIVKYQGNDNYIVGLCKDDKNKKYVFFSYIDVITIDQKTEEYNVHFDTYDKMKIFHSKQCILEFLLKESKKDNSILHLLEIEDEKEYTTIIKFLEYIL